MDDYLSMNFKRWLFDDGIIYVHSPSHLNDAFSISKILKGEKEWKSMAGMTMMFISPE